MQEKEPIRLKITEIFHSIQGESTLAGERFSFVRLTGCPLRCRYCDTQYAFTGGQWMTVPEIVAEVARHQTKWVLVTGGEPLAQKNCAALVEALSTAGKKVSIETSGEQDVTPYVGRAKIIMDVKTPSSGETAQICFENLEKLLPSDEIKFVICGRKDYEWAREICREHDLTRRFTVLFSPAHDELKLPEMAKWILTDKLDVRLQLQLHKIVWGKHTRGV